MTFVTRADYLSPFFNELAYCLAVERLLGIEAPLRAQVLRVMFSELNRIASHLVWLATSGMELGAVSVMLFGFREREMILDIFEMATGLRMNHAYMRVGGVVMDLPPGADGQDRGLARHPAGPDPRVREPALERTRSGSNATRASAILTAEDAIALGVTGPVLRAAGVADGRAQDEPYAGYETYEFDVATRRLSRLLRAGT